MLTADSALMGLHTTPDYYLWGLLESREYPLM